MTLPSRPQTPACLPAPALESREVDLLAHLDAGYYVEFIHGFAAFYNCRSGLIDGYGLDVRAVDVQAVSRLEDLCYLTARPTPSGWRYHLSEAGRAALTSEIAKASRRRAAEATVAAPEAPNTLEIAHTPASQPAASSLATPLLAGASQRLGARVRRLCSLGRLLERAGRAPDQAHI